MALFRKLFYRKPPDRLVEIAERVYVFDSCFSTDVLGEDEYKVYFSGIVPRLQDLFTDASFMVFNFSERKKGSQSQTSDILSQYGMTVMEYPLQYEGCALLPLEMIHHFIRSSESWLSLEGKKNVLLMNCERGGWPILAFMLAGLLLYRKQCEGEQKTLEMVYRQAPRELFHVLSPVNPQPSQKRYLQYISRMKLGSNWPSSDTPLILDHLLLRDFPMFGGGNGYRPVLRIYGQDPLTPRNRNPELIFSSSKMKKHVLQAEVKIDIHCHVQGDVVLECIQLNKDILHEEVMFRIMFHTAFVHSSILKFNRDEVDVLCDAKEQFPKDFRVEVLFLDANDVVPDISTAKRSDDKTEIESSSTEDFFEVEEIFSNIIEVQEVKDYDIEMVHANVIDNADHRAVWKQSLDPPTFQRCKSFKGGQNLGVKTDYNVDAVKDITVDDLKFKMDDKVDSGLHVVKDIVVDYGDKKPNSLLFSVNVLRRIGIQELIDDAYEELEAMESKKYMKDTSMQNFESDVPSKKFNDDGWRLKSEKLRPQASRKQPPSTVKLNNDLDVVKQITEQQPENQGCHEKQTELNTLPRWIPHGYSSHMSSKNEFSSPSRYNSAPVTFVDSYSNSTSKSTSATPGLLLSTDGTEEPKSNRVNPLKYLSSPPHILTSNSQSPFPSVKEICVSSPTSTLSNIVLHQDPTLPEPTTTLAQSPVLHANALLHASYPPPPPPPPPPVSKRVIPKNSGLMCGNTPKNKAPPAPPPPPSPPQRTLHFPCLSNVKVLPPPPPPPPPIQRVTSLHSIHKRQPLSCPPISGITPPLPPPFCEAASPPQPTHGSLLRDSSPRRHAGDMSSKPGAKGINSSSDAKTSSIIRGHGLSRSFGMGFSAAVPQRSSLKPLHWTKVTRAVQGSLWEELQKYGDPEIAPDFDVSELEKLFSVAVPKPVDLGGKSVGRRKSVGSKLDKVHLIDIRRANNTEIMLTRVRMPLSDIKAAVLSMDESVLDVEQVENLIKFCPTKEEIELLKGYIGDKDKLGKCEQYFLEMMQVPRVETKLRVFSFKIHFRCQIVDFKRSLNTINSVCQEVKNSRKLKEILKRILCLGNMLNQGTARGSAIGFRLDSLLKLTDTRASNSKMTLMHYLCKVLASKSPTLLDFFLDLHSLEAASQIQLKSLAEEMQAITKGMEKVKQELVVSEDDGPVSDIFRQTLKEFVTVAETEVESVTILYSMAGRNADALALYFGEDPARCPFEQVTGTLFNFMKSFRRAHGENCKQAEMEIRKLRR